MITPLKQEREKRGISAEAVAVAVNVKQPTINRIENGKKRPSPDLANRIAKFLDNAVTRDQILFPEDYMAADQPSPKKPIRSNLRKAS